jgi:hypothetical protein
MAINIISAPTQLRPYSISECAEWVVRPDDSDVATTPGSAANVYFKFKSSPPALGSGIFKIAGIDLSVDNSTDCSATTFKVVAGDGLATMYNFVCMLNSNYFFASRCDVVINDAALEVTLVWKECGAQPDFGPAGMNFSAISSILDASSYANGVNPVYRSNFKLLFRVFRKYTGAVTQFESVAPGKTCSGANSVPFDIMPIARTLLRTPLPDISANTHPTVGPDGPIQYFNLQVGWLYNDAAGAVKYGDLTFMPQTVAVFNGYFEPADVFGVRRYWSGAPGGLPPGQTHIRFLTSKPLTLRVFTHSRCWLWYFLNESVVNFSQLKLRVVVRLKTGTNPVYNLDVPNSGYGMNAVNVSPGFIATSTGNALNNIKAYDLSIFTDATQLTEATLYEVDDACKNGTDLYFLGKLGGIETLPVYSVERAVERRFDEAELRQSCEATSWQRAAYGGKTQVNHVATDVYTLVVRSKGEAYEEFVRHAIASPQLWLRLTDENNKPMAFKFRLEGGATTIKKMGEQVDYILKGRLYEIKSQAVNES